MTHYTLLDRDVVRHVFVAASLLLLTSACETAKPPRAQAAATVQQASPAPVPPSLADPEANYLSAKRAYLAFLDSARKHGTSDSVLNVRDDDAIRDLAARMRKIFGPLHAEIFADSGTSNVSSLLPSDMDFGAVDGITYWSSDSMRVLVTTRALLTGYLKERAAAGDTTLPLDPISTLARQEVYSHAFPEDTFVLRYADIPVDHAGESGVVAAMLVARAQDYAAFTPDNVMVSVIRGDRIYLVEARPRALIPPDASCVAIWTNAERQRDSLYDAGQSTPSDTAARDSSFRIADRIEERGQASVGQCYAEHVRSDPRFAAIVQQVAEIVRRLPRG